jgi:hypothetical protein
VIQVLGNTYLNASITQSGVFIGSLNSMMSHSSLLKDSQNAPKFFQAKFVMRGIT